MDEDADRIADRMRSTRQEFGGQLRRLGYRAKNVPWRDYYESNPWLFVAAAFASGLLLSAAIGAKRRPDVPEEERRDSMAGTVDGEAFRQNSGTSAVWDRIRSALLAVAGAQISRFVREVAPGLLGSLRSAAHEDTSEARPGNGAGTHGGDGRAAAEALYQ